MKEIAPGLYHWTAKHPKIGFEVSSYFVADSATLLDPMVPPDDTLAWFRGEHPPEHIVLTNRHHDRQSDRFCDEFGIAPVLAPESGLHEFEDRPLEVAGYAVGEEVVPGIVCHDVGAICPDDMALEIRSVGALALADGLMHYRGQLGFVPDDYMDDPPETKRGLVGSFRELLSVDFDTLLFAHGDPLVGGAKEALRRFTESQ